MMLIIIVVSVFIVTKPDYIPSKPIPIPQNNNIEK